MWYREENYDNRKCDKINNRKICQSDFLCMQYTKAKNCNEKTLKLHITKVPSEKLSV